MYFFSIITLAAFWTFSVLPTSMGNDCDPVPVCSTFRTWRLSHDDQRQYIQRFENETQIGNQGHWAGVVPEHYRLHLDFHNRTHYSGSVNITFRLLQATDWIMINHDLSLSIDYPEIVIRPECGSAASVETIPLTTRCIDAFLRGDQTLIIKLKEAMFDPRFRYVISFQSFQSRSYLYGSEGAMGLREAAGHDFYSLTTIFQMRHARTVFPCFDHPALKARFELCMEYPSDLTAASNTEPIDSRHISLGRKRTCFEQTPIIPTYLFTFALMDGYQSESMQIPGGPKLELLALSREMARLRWMLHETVPIMQYMQRVTKFKFPLKRLAFIAVYPAPYWGIENFGLVTLQGTVMAIQSESSYALLYHEIVHQWLGNVVTVKNWREICLQEGLTAYFEWRLVADRLNRSLDKKAEETRKANSEIMLHLPYASRDYSDNRDITGRCYQKPPFFFHAIVKWYGFEALEQFLGRLIAKKPFGSAGLELWDETLAEVTSENMRGYIKGWFLQPGPLYLIASKIPGTNCIRIRQQIFIRGQEPTVARPVPLNVYFFSSFSRTTVHRTVSRSLDHTICGSAHSAFLLDPDAYTFARKAYTADNYRQLFTRLSSSSPALTESQQTAFVQEFCIALLDDILPIGDEPPTTAPSDWLAVFQLARNFTVNIRHLCTICLKPKREIVQAYERLNWDLWCEHLRLIKLLNL